MECVPDHPVIQNCERYGQPDSRDLSLCRCAQCGREIYLGDDYLTDTPAAPDSPGATTLHKDCLMDWVKCLGASAIAEAFGFERKEGHCAY